MPFNFLFGTAVLGTKAIMDIQQAENEKAYEKIRKELRKQEIEEDRILFSKLDKKILNEFENHLQECGKYNCEIPNAYVKGGELYICAGVCSFEDTKQIAKEHIVSYADRQPRWRFAKVKDFQNRQGLYDGISKAAYCMTIYKFNNIGDPLTQDDIDLFQQLINKHGTRYGAFGMGMSPLPDCMK